MLAGAVLLIAWAAWARGGTPPGTQWPLVFLGAAMLGALLLAPSVPRDLGQACMGRRSRTGQTARDPVFIVGACFLCLLTIQWLNAGRDLVFEKSLEAWRYAPPRLPWLPAAVTRADAAEMLRWFFPAWALLLVLRNGLSSQAGRSALCRGMALSSALLAAVGIIQLASGTWSVYWLKPLPPDVHFFASFGYANHAGAYFGLMFMLSSALLVDDVANRSRGGRRSAMRLALGAAVILNLAGSVFSLSKAWIILCALLAPLVAGYALWAGFRYLRPADRINAATAAVVLLTLASLLVHGVARRRVVSEFIHIMPARAADAPQAHPSTDWAVAARLAFEAVVGEDRRTVWQTAYRIWGDHPCFGAGGWCQQYLSALYLPPERWDMIASEGKANVHCDPLQFLSEFGIVGAGLMLLILFILLEPFRRGRRQRTPIAVIGAGGLLIVAAYSLVDLPFRCPAILYAWLAMLAVLPRRHM